MASAAAVPVIPLTGHLGAGKTTVLNSLLAAPGARLGVIVNDFGAIDVDAALVTGQVDEAAAIAGGCLCCLPDTTPLRDALRTLSDPQLTLDAIMIEASGVAEPVALVQQLRMQDVPRTRSGGLVEVVDASGARPSPARFGAASLVAVTKLDLVPEGRRERTLEGIGSLARSHNPEVQVVAADHGALDPELVLDVAQSEDPEGQLPLAALMREQREHERGHAHTHADAVTVHAQGAVDPGRLADLLEEVPEGVYRLKGIVRVRAGRGDRDGPRYLVNVVGWRINVAPLPSAPDTATPASQEGLVAIGMHLDQDVVRAHLEHALLTQETAQTPSAGSSGLSRLRRLERLSV